MTRLDRALQQHLHITLHPPPPLHLPLPTLPITILVNDNMQARARARHAHVGYASVPVGFDVGEAGYDDDVVFEALEAGDGGPGDGLQGRASEVGDVVFRKAAEGLGLEVFLFVGGWGLEEEDGDSAGIRACGKEYV